MPPPGRTCAGACRMIATLTLSHFRSHRLTRLDFDTRPVAIHGANGAGKTNLIEAISLLSPGRGLRRAGAQELARRPDAPGWKIAATLHGPAPHEVETAAQATSPRTVRIDGKPAPQVALGALLRILWLTPAMDRLWSEAPDGRRRFFDRIALSFDPAHAEAALAYDKALRERNRMLRDDIRDARWFDAVEAQMAGAGARLAAGRRAALIRLARAQDGAQTAFPAADLAILAPEGTDAPESEPDLAGALAAGRRRDRAAGRTLTGPHRADISAVWSARDLPAAQCSTGEQKALLLSLLLANARALAGDRGEPPILLLDEVAAHLDESRRAALYEELLALGAQAFLTGTGPELFAPFGPRARLLAATETPAGTLLTETP